MVVDQNQDTLLDLPETRPFRAIRASQAPQRPGVPTVHSGTDVAERVAGGFGTWSQSQWTSFTLETPNCQHSSRNSRPIWKMADLQWELGRF